MDRENMLGGYSWSQTDDVVHIAVPLAASATKHQLRLGLQAADRIVVSLAGESRPRVACRLWGRIDRADATWYIETMPGPPERKMMTIVLPKHDARMWPHLAHIDDDDDDENNKNDDTKEEGGKETDGWTLDETSRYEIGLEYERRGNYGRALRMIDQAANEGCLAAQLKMAALYASGKEHSGYPLDQDPVLSFKYHLMAAELGNAEALFFVANSYHFGHGVDKNIQTASVWYAKALEQPDALGDYLPIAQFNQGLLYHTGGDGLEVDNAKSQSLWHLADKSGSAQAAFNLGVMHLRGQGGMAIDVGRSVEFFLRASNRDPKLSVPADVLRFMSASKTTTTTAQSPSSSPPTSPAKSKSRGKSRNPSKAKPKGKEAVQRRSENASLSSWFRAGGISLSIVSVATAALWLYYHHRLPIGMGNLFSFALSPFRRH